MSKINVDIHNRFDVVVRDSISGKIKQEAHGHNMILNQFWSTYIGSSSPLGYIHFGSGTVEPKITDTSLTTFIAAKSTTSVSVDVSTFYEDGVIKNRKTIRLEAGERTGASISEVGFGGSSAGTLRTKSLLKDSNGNPLTIIVGALDVVDIYATFYARVSMDLVTGVNGMILNPRNTLARCLCGESGFFYSYLSGNFTSGLDFPYCLHGYDGTNMYLDKSISNGAQVYDVANKKITVNYPNTIASSGNATKGFSGFAVNGLVIELPTSSFTQPLIEKEVIATGDGSTKDFICMFGRIINDNSAKLFVNDVEVPATFDYLIPTYVTGLGGYMKVISETVNLLLFENTINTHIFPSQMRVYNGSLHCSNDGITWTTVGSGGSSGTYITIPVEHRTKRYWKIEKTTPGLVGQVSYLTTIPVVSSTSLPIIHASTPPPVGATIALTYRPKCIAKDDKHIINNVKLELIFNEYTPD